MRWRHKQINKHNLSEFIAGDILAKSFKWIYAKCFLCRICPNIARRRLAREKHKEKLRQNNGEDPVGEYHLFIHAIKVRQRKSFAINLQTPSNKSSLFRSLSPELNHSANIFFPVLAKNKAQRTCHEHLKPCDEMCRMFKIFSSTPFRFTNDGWKEEMKPLQNELLAEILF